MLAQFTALPEGDLPGEAVSGLGDVELLAGDELEQVQGLWASMRSTTPVGSAAGSAFYL
ncbi:hypothetical protein ACWCQL_36040 [Streptomyces sp. NPDC002073]